MKVISVPTLQTLHDTTTLHETAARGGKRVKEAAVAASEVVSSSADAVTDRAEQQGNKAEKQEDNPDCPDDSGLGEDADDKQDNSYGNHGVS
jgi:hypothetical protein